MLIHQHLRLLHVTLKPNSYWAKADTDGYNFFFEQARPRTLSRSQPIGDFPNTSFDDLLEILIVLRQTYHFTIITANLTKEQNIQLRKHGVLW